jgi:hypothetical protein
VAKYQLIPFDYTTITDFDLCDPMGANYDAAECAARWNERAIKTTLSSYVCPSAAIPPQRPQGWGYSNYRAVVGWNEFLDPTSPYYDPTADPTIPQYRLHTGTSGLNSAVRFRDITDGESNTLLMGESLIGFWGDGYSCCASIRDDETTGAGPYFNTYRMTCTDAMGVPEPCEPYDPTIGYVPNMEYQFFGFGSFHDEVVHFALGDGSARPISKIIDADLLRALATASDGDRIPNEF